MTCLIADKENPYMDLDNKICKNPTFDMLGVCQCGRSERRSG